MRKPTTKAELVEYCVQTRLDMIEADKATYEELESYLRHGRTGYEEYSLEELQDEYELLEECFPREERHARGLLDPAEGG